MTTVTQRYLSEPGAPEPCVDTCIGPEGDGECTHPPQFIVAGDNACRFHLVAIVRQRSKDTGGGAVSVDPNWHRPDY